MKYNFLTSASLLCLLGLVQADHLDDLLSDPKYKPNTLGHVIPGRFIIEFDENYHGSSLDFVNDIETDLDRTEPIINTHIKMSIAHDFDSASIFRGISISLSEEQQLEEGQEEADLHMQSYQATVLRKILQQHRVKHVYPVTEIARPNVELLTTTNSYELDANDTVILKAPNVQLPRGGPGLPFTHAMTQVNKVHDRLGLRGQGILVGIIDSGIDYRHPAFGGGFGAGFPVRYGYDLVGNDFDSRDPFSRRQSDTPLDNCADGSGHGTHVAGIIAANDELFNFTGVANEATLGVWRVFGCNGATSNDMVIKALLSAYETGCDVINLSLGSSSNWPEDPTSIVANRISEKGSIVIAAAGNAGSVGAFYISSPGTGLSTIATASIDNIYNLEQSVVTAEGAEYPYLLSSTSKSFPNGTIVSYANTNVTADACDDVKPDNDLSGKLVLVQRGQCTFDEKALAIEKYGGVGIVVYDNQEEDNFTPQALKTKLPMASISLKAGTDIKKLLITKYKNGMQLQFKTALTLQKTATGNTMSKFSSVGPLYDMSLKPDIAAPGGFIFSTLPLANGGYGVLSGTSMASPYVAGAFALYMQKFGKENGVAYLRDHFQNYARPTLQRSHVDNPARQGAGLIQLYDTIQQSVHVSPGHLSFNDTTNIKEQTLAISNSGNDTITYRILHKPSLAIAPFNTTLQGYTPLEPANYTSRPVYATLKLFNDTITLGPGETKQVHLHVNSISATAQNEPYPIYGGFVQFSPVNNTAAKPIHVPYVGVRGSLAQLPIFDQGFPSLLIPNGTSIVEKTSPDGHVTTGLVIDRTNFTMSFVISLFRLVTGSAHVKTEVLNRNMTQIGLFHQERNLARNTMADYDFVFTQRWNGTMANSAGELVPVPPGFYHLRWKALKLLSDPNRESSWESHTSPLIHIQR